MATKGVFLTKSDIGATDHLPTGELSNLSRELADLGFVLDLVSDQRGTLSQIVINHRFDQSMAQSANIVIPLHILMLWPNPIKRQFEVFGSHIASFEQLIYILPGKPSYGSRVLYKQ